MTDLSTKQMPAIMRRYGRVSSSTIVDKYTYSFSTPYDVVPSINHTGDNVKECIESVYTRVMELVWNQCLIEEAS